MRRRDGLRVLSRERLVLSNDANIVVREVVMQIGNFDLGHVTRSAVRFAHWTCTTGMMGNGIRGKYVAGEALFIIGSHISYQRLVWIVTRGTCDPRVSFPPALAIFEPV